MVRSKRNVIAAFLFTLLIVALDADQAYGFQVTERIFFNGKIVTVDDSFSIAEAMAIKGHRIVKVGSNEEVLGLASQDVLKIDLQGRMVLPGLIDSHVHATDASIYEFDHPIPEMETIDDVLAYIRSRAEIEPEGEWIIVRQVFVTRLRDPRFPTRTELDRVAPKHPVAFITGPDAAVNSLALQASGLDEKFQITDGPGLLERDPATERLNGILRSCTRLIRSRPSKRLPTFEQKAAALQRLIQDYNRVGITSICDRNANEEGLQLYEKLLLQQQLTCRVFLSYGIEAQESLEGIESKLETLSKHPRHAYDENLWLRGVKIFLDGGMLTGSAYMRQPWGKSSIYSITDSDYRGVLYVEPEKLYRIAKGALSRDLQMTAHAVGDGAIHALIDAYEKVNLELPLQGKRPCITHCNFLSQEGIASMKRLEIVADMQPIWLWMDGAILKRQFGEDRTRFFQPYRSLLDSGVRIGGGSDHMQKVGSLRAVNPYNPFLGMWIAVARQSKRLEGEFHSEQKISRQEAIRLYTINNAYLTFEEKEKGSLQPGKLADFIVLDRDFLQCAEADMRSTQVLKTYLGGELVYEKSAE